MGACSSSCCPGIRRLCLSLRSPVLICVCLGKARDGLYEPVLADSEREAVADLLQYLENVLPPDPTHLRLALLTYK